MFKHLLVPIDGSSGSAHALAKASELAKQLDARLTLLTAITIPTVIPVGPLDSFITTEPVPNPEAVDRIQAEVEAIKAKHGADRVQFFLTEGDPETVILETIGREKPDLVVMGTAGLGAVERFLLGSVSGAVTRKSHVPVCVVPPAE